MNPQTSPQAKGYSYITLYSSKILDIELKMIKFPSIEQSRQVLPAIIKDAQFTQVDPETKTPCYNRSAELPVLEFRGTVKLHGSNAAMVQTISSATGKSVNFQSRERILAVGKDDLMGFCAYMSNQTKAVKSIFESIYLHLESGSVESKKEVNAIAVFGEWCGTGIQKGVALSKLPKMFVIFAIKIVYAGETPAERLDLSQLPEVKDEKALIFNIMQFKTFSLVIDFNKEESIVEAKKKMDEFTLSVEDECPVGKHFGVSGTGEGIVWQAIQAPNLPVFKAGRYTTDRFWFKTKGVKHANYRKLEPAHVNPEVVAKIDAFVDSVLTPGRLQWVNGDVMKEDYDRIEEAGIEKKALGGPISAKAKKWYVEQLEERLLEDVKKWGLG
jgi:hypothetical protein